MNISNEILSAIKGINFETIADARQAMKDGNKARFDGSMKLAKQAAKFKAFFASDKGKELLKETEGLKVENLIKEIFGVNKSWFYKMTRAADLDNSVVSNYRKEGRNAEKRGEVFTLSIANLLKFAKGETEGQEDGEGQEQSEAKPTTIMSFSAKGKTEDDKGVAVTLTDDGEVHTQNEAKDILAAINTLAKALKQVQKA